MSSHRETSERPSDYLLRSQAAFALAGMLGPVLFWVLLLLLDAARPDYSNLSSAVSEIGAVGVRYSVVGQATFVLHGVLLIAFAVGLSRDLWNSVTKLGPITLLLIGTSSLAAGVFSLDAAHPEAFTNVAHGLFTLPGNLASVAAPFLVARRMRSDGRWQGYNGYSLITGGLLVVLYLLPLLAISTNSAPDWFLENTALAGRAYHAILSLWVFIIALHMFRLAIASESPRER